MKAKPIVRVAGSKLPSKIMVVSMSAKVAAKLAEGTFEVGAGGGRMADAPHSCHENGKTGSEVLGGGGGIFM